MLRLLQNDPGAKPISAIISHSLQVQGWLGVIVNPRTQPTKEWADIRGIKMLAIAFEILLLVRHPDSPPELALVVVHWNLDDTVNKEVAPLNNAKIVSEKTFRVFC